MQTKMSHLLDPFAHVWCSVFPTMFEPGRLVREEDRMVCPQEMAREYEPQSFNGCGAVGENCMCSRSSRCWQVTSKRDFNQVFCIIVFCLRCYKTATLPLHNPAAHLVHYSIFSFFQINGGNLYWTHTGLCKIPLKIHSDFVTFLKNLNASAS